MSRHEDSYHNRHNRRHFSLRSFYDNNCDEAWEQIKGFFRNKTVKRLSVAGGLVAALTLVAVLVFHSLFVKPELPDRNKTDANSGSTEQDIDYGDGVQPVVSGERKSEDYYTVLVLGRDTGGGGNTDTMLLASYDVTNQKATVMSIPRDTMVNVSWDIKRINSVYNYNGQGSKGIAALYKEISQLVGFEPDYQVIVEWDAVGEIVEAMGGIYFDVPRDMNYDDPYQDLHIHQTKGYRLLSGEDVMQVLRYRHDNDMSYGYPDGDLGRIRTQQALLKAMVTQLLQLKNVTKIGDFAKVVKNNVESDLSFNEMLWFGKQAVMGGLTVESVNFVTMPNTAKYVYSRAYPAYPQSYVFPNAQELLDLVNNELSPFTKKFAVSDLDIMTLNSDGSLSSSTGHVEDGKAAVRPPVNVNPYTGKISAWPGSETDGDADGETTAPGDGETTEPDGEMTDPGAEDPGAEDPDGDDQTGDTPAEESPDLPAPEEPEEPEEPAELGGGEFEIPDWLTNMD